LDKKEYKNKFQSDICVAEFFNKQRNDKEYLKKVKANLKEDIKNYWEDNKKIKDSKKINFNC